MSVNSKSIDRGFGPIFLVELLLISFTAGAICLIHQIYPLDAFKMALVSYTLFSVGTLIVLKLMLMRTPLLPGRYTVKEHPKVRRLWQVFNFLAMNNLFFHYQNGLLPPPVRKFFSRALGAKIGPGLISIAGPILDPYLITLGEDTMLGQDSILKPSAYDGHTLVLGAIHIGEGSVIGARSVVMPDVVIGKNALVKAMSFVAAGTQIADNEIWGGIPARKMGDSPVEETPTRFTDSAYMVLCGVTQTFVLGVSGVLTWAGVLFWHWDLFLALVAFYICQCLIALLVLTAVRLVFPFKEGIYSYRTDKWICYRWNLFAFIGITNLFLHYQRDFTPPVIRRFFSWVMGARLPLLTNFVSAGGIVFDPFFVDIEQGAVIGNEALLLPHAIAVDKLYLKRVRVGQGATIGDRCLVMSGAQIGRGAVIEPLSLVTSNTHVPDGEIWGGVPARKKGDGPPESSTPLRSIDIVGTLFTEALILTGSIQAVWMVNVVYRISPFLDVVVFYCAWVMLTLIVAKLIRTVYKFPEGEFLQHERPVLFFFWKLHAFLCVTNLFIHYQNALLPPSMRKMFLALLGTNVTFRGINSMAAAVVADPYFVTIGLNALLGHESLILTLSMRGERLTLKRVRIAEGAVIGERAVVMPGADIGEYAEILPLSLVEENTKVPAHEIWGGIPAKKLGDKNLLERS